VRAGHLQGDGRHEWAGVMFPRREPTAFQNTFEKGRLFVRGIEEQAGGGVAMVRGDDEPPACGQTLDEAPEIITCQLSGDITSESIQALTGSRSIMELSIWPLVPEDPVRGCVDEAGAIRPRQIDAFCLAGR